MSYRFPDRLVDLHRFPATYKEDLSVEFLANKLTRIFPFQNKPVCDGKYMA